MTNSLFARSLRQIRQQGLLRVMSQIHLEWQLGRHVEAQDNLIDYAGLKINLDIPVIGTRMKGKLMTGQYERPMMSLIERYLPGDLPAIELGGSIGVISCVINRRLASPENHVVIEANPQVLPLLRTNRDLNHCRYTIEHAALAYDSEEIPFFFGSTFLAGAILPRRGKSVRVPTISIAQLLGRYGFERIDIVVDIEGGEAQLVERESEVLRTRVRWLVMECHPALLGAYGVDRLLENLRFLGFLVRAQDEDVMALENVGLQSE